MRKWLIRLVVLGLLIVAFGLWLTRPKSAPADAVVGLIGDPVAGAFVFHAAGCASCHAAKDATGPDKLILSGGQVFPSPFGSFSAPNISPDPTHGIGNWSAHDLLNAMRHGTSPEGHHYYPAFPYASYARADTQDIVDLHSYLMTLPGATTPSQPHDLPFPFNIRASLGGWKLLFLREKWLVDGDLPPAQTRGRYLVEALGHCGECHTPRNLLGGSKNSVWLSGAPNPTGRGTIPNITPGALDWSQADLVEYFTSGFTPDFDTAGGHMANVIENLSQLPIEDRQAIAAYLSTVPAVN